MCTLIHCLCVYDGCCGIKAFSLVPQFVAFFSNILFAFIAYSVPLVFSAPRYFYLLRYEDAVRKTRGEKLRARIKRTLSKRQKRATLIIANERDKHLLWLVENYSIKKQKKNIYIFKYISLSLSGEAIVTFVTAVIRATREIIITAISIYSGEITRTKSTRA